MDPQKPDSIFDLYRFLGLGGLSLFVFLPYKQIVGDSWFLQAVVLAMLLFSIFLWNLFYPSKTETRFENQTGFTLSHLTGLDYIYCLFIVLLLFLYQKKFLYAPIAWRGDEDFHITRTLHFQSWFLNELEENKLLILTIILCFTIGCILYKKLSGGKYRKKYLFIPLLTIPFIICPPVHLVAYRLTRYPPFLFIVETLFANPVFSTGFSEFAHRLAVFVPYLLIFLVLFCTAHSLRIKQYLLYCIPIIAITIPLLYYHGTIVYIEMLVLLIQSWVLFRIFQQPKITQCLLFEIAAISSLGGVIKETSIPFLLSVFIFITIKILRDKNNLFRNKSLIILKFFYIIFLPACIYLYFRNVFGGLRPYAAHFSNLINPGSYYTYFLAILQQLTLPSFLISFLGLIYLISSRKYINAVLLSLLNFAFYFVFTTSDSYELIGYSRFMLHFIPTFFTGLLGAGIFMNTLSAKYSRYLAVFIGIIIGLNIYYSPRNFADRSNWGVYNCDTAEYYLPYPTAIKYIGSHFPKHFSFIATGMYYRYYFNFYIWKFSLKQRFRGTFYKNERQYDSPDIVTKSLDLEGSFRVARQKKANLLLFHNLNSLVPIKKSYPQIKFIKKFSLGPHSLDLYELLENKTKFSSETMRPHSLG